MTDLNSLRSQQHPSLHLPGTHATSLQRQFTTSIQTRLRCVLLMWYGEEGEYSPPAPGIAAPASVSPVTPLSARTFGTWTLLSSIIRLYAAYHISNTPVYHIAFASYIIAAVHFGSEWLVFGSTRLGAGLAGPLVVSSVTITWMVMQWGFYLPQ